MNNYSIDKNLDVSIMKHSPSDSVIYTCSIWLFVCVTFKSRYKLVDVHDFLIDSLESTTLTNVQVWRYLHQIWTPQTDSTFWTNPLLLSLHLLWDSIEFFKLHTSQNIFNKFPSGINIFYDNSKISVRNNQSIKPSKQVSVLL